MINFRFIDDLRPPGESPSDAIRNPDNRNEPMVYICGFLCRIVSTLHTTGKYCKMKQSTIDEMVGATGSVDSQTA